MPKLVDHAARRAEIAAAVRRVVLAEGAAAATVRRVAREAGWSPGAVRHYAPDQAALLRAVVAQAFAEVPGRVESHLRRWYDDPAARPGAVEAAAALLEELLPLDAARRAELHVWLAMLDQARHDPELTEALRATWVGTRQLARIATAWLRDLDLGADLGRWQQESLPPRHEQAAAALQAVVDGLSLQGFYRPDEVDAAQMRVTLRAHLEEVSRGA